MVADSGRGLEAGSGGEAPSVRRKLMSRLRLGHVVMVAAALFALVLNLLVLQDNRETIEIVVAATDLGAGTTLARAHLSPVEIPADDALAARLVRADALDQWLGQLTTRSIGNGEPILKSDLLVVSAQDGLRAMSIPIDQSQAVAGGVTAGDAVDVVLVVDGVATYIATNIQVLGVPDSGTNALGARTGYAPTVAVTATEALRIAAALDTGTVHLIRSTGSGLPELDAATAIEPEDPVGEG
jgi:Flp pilus assembly protein CpaB